MPGKKKSRSFRDGHKRIVAARQQWRCAKCDTLLQSSFQVDHIIPLFRGGEDSISNAECLCACCHAQKTQLEQIERHAESRRRREEEARASQVAFEDGVRRDEYASMHISSDASTGKSECAECGLRFYSILRHTTCPVVEERIEAKTRPKHRLRVPEGARKCKVQDRPAEDDAQNPNPFIRFARIR